MQLVHALKSGKICLHTSGKGTLQLRIEDETIGVSLLNKKLPKNIPETIVVPEEKGLFGMLPQLKSLATQFKENGLTVMISYKGSILLTLGLKAHAKLSQLVAGTDATEVNSLSKFMQLLV